ncbi:hypothetical protein TSAR_014759 [Trichomalopsis sarcophagae]|uniref:Uncharacterized protein n=1 Tax=Trichomalopsis sarcophagae TaxID=543379 RepID=A0A232FKN5_9HYME|nr:hypothetical protein TSAR_014759 [Trichomalopsis sarcophagae]
MGINILYYGILSVLVLVNLDNPMNSIRYIGLMIGPMVHLFYLSWPGQKLMHRSHYCNEWYEGSVQSKKLLSFFTLRCSEPCLLTAGGLVTA